MESPCHGGAPGINASSAGKSPLRKGPLLLLHGQVLKQKLEKTQLCQIVSCKLTVNTPEVGNTFIVDWDIIRLGIPVLESE
jgi:hypothetical protein